MKKRKVITPDSNTGFVVALAWPDARIKQSGAWYDDILGLMGFRPGYMYKVGHAAAVLVKPVNGECFYYDFGRYHTPFGYARVRCAETDHELAIKTRARFSEDGKTILNFREILEEINANKAFNGLGVLYGAWARADFEKARKEAVALQNKSLLSYGPFIWFGSNCSRFVHRVIRRALPFPFRLWYSFTIPLTPTTMTNVVRLGDPVAVEADQSHCTKKYFNPVED
jgi:hypothetical protein